MTARTILIMAGGTGGHIMPGLAVAQEMRTRGWNVVWLGNPDRMEGQIVPGHDIPLEALRFSGVRGKGLAAMLKLPFGLAAACRQARQVLARLRPDVVLGMGGYVAVPGGLMARVSGVPVVIHEQNAIAGTANRMLARIARKVLTGFPGALPGALMVGNPVRQEVLALPAASERYARREGPLRLLVVGGSLGAHVLNEVVPAALALLPEEARPVVVHQAGAQHIDSLTQRYQAAGVRAECHAFITDMASRLGEADLMLCRAGAMTVAEVAAAGVAALFIPLPHAIDDHQTANARYLSDCNGAWMQKQSDFTPEWLAGWLKQRNRDELAHYAGHAHEHASLNAAQQIADACENVAGRAE